MRVLVTGGTGVVGTATVTALVDAGHAVRLLSRHARADSRQWPAGVEARPGNVTDAASLHGAADGCDVVVHLVAIVDEVPPDATFERINVGGTRNVLAEAQRAGNVRVVYVSSLGADVGESDYHVSKRRGEELTRAYPGPWTILRPGNVYGPGDEQISLLLRMVRTLPAIPVIGGGDQPVQPAWHEDIARGMVQAVERDDLDGRTLELAGAELTTQNDLIARLARITDRDVTRIPLPEMLASAGMKALGLVGIDVPFNEGQLKMLDEGNRIAPGRENALVTVLGVVPTSLDAGLELLADAQAEQLPEDGIGAMKRKRIWGDIQNSRMTPEQLVEHFRTHFDDVTPNFLRVAPEQLDQLLHPFPPASEVRGIEVVPVAQTYSGLSPACKELERMLGSMGEVPAARTVPNAVERFFHEAKATSASSGSSGRVIMIGPSAMPKVFVGRVPSSRVESRSRNSRFSHTLAARFWPPSPPMRTPSGL